MGNKGKYAKMRKAKEKAEESSSSMALTSSVSQMTITSSNNSAGGVSGQELVSFSRRKAKGVLGIPISLLANHFEMSGFTEKGSSLTIWKYNVDIKPETDNNGASRVFVRRLSKEDTGQVFWEFVHNHPGYFPSNPTSKLFFTPFHSLYSVVDLLDTISVGKVNFKYGGLENDRIRNRETEFSVEISPVGDPIKFDDFRAVFEANPRGRNDDQLMALQSVIKSIFSQNDTFSPMGRKLLYATQHVADLGCGRLMHRGFYASVQITDNWKPVVVLDIKTSVVHEPILATEFARKLFNWNRIPEKLKPNERKILEKEFKGLKFKTVYNNFTVKCAKLSMKSARELSFEENGTITNVEQYFKKKHNLTIKYANWPMIERSNKSMLPMEFCRIVELQRVPVKNITPQQQSNWLKLSAVPPDQRLANTRQAISDAVKPVQGVLQDLKMSFSMQLMRVPGRKLQEPQIQHLSKAIVNPFGGTWNLARNRLKIKGRSIRKWGILVMCQDNEYNLDEIKKFGKALADYTGTVGMAPFPPCLGVEACGMDPSDIDTKLKKVSLVDFVVCVISDRNPDDVHRTIKYSADVKYDVGTMCVKLRNVRRCIEPKGEQLLANLCLKLNARLGGINQTVVGMPALKAEGFLKSSFIVFGADVNHPDPGDSHSPSLGGVCASMDMSPFQYEGRVVAQSHRMEVIPNLAPTIHEFLMSFYNRWNQLKPERLIYFRDGVAEGYFAEVFDTEMKAIRDACRSLNKGYEPKITFIVVSRGHNTRLYLDNMPKGGKNFEKNVPAGTTVDEKITHPVLYDFYLNSHQGLQGTSVPGHYTVLHDDSDLSSDAVQELVYRLCYTYAKATKAISVPPPIYYADQIAERARQHLTAFCREKNFDLSTKESVPELIELEPAFQIGKKLKSTMYWM